MFCIFFDKRKLIIGYSYILILLETYLLFFIAFVIIVSNLQPLELITKVLLTIGFMSVLIGILTVYYIVGTFDNDFSKKFKKNRKAIFSF